MSDAWPRFVTRDLGDTPEDDAEMSRRWEVYERDMKALIERGGVHQDEDGWWVETATGKLIGPDPDIERPLTDEELAAMRPIDEVAPELAKKLRRGRPRVENPKVPVSMRLDPDVVDRLKADGRGWQTRANALLREALGL